MFWYSEPWTLHYWLWLAAGFALSAVVTWAALHYARRRALVDLPGRRRSHAAPTPRGAGIGIVVAALASIFVLAHAEPAAASGLRLLVPIAFVAAIGWIDDHRPLSVLLRLGVHCLAVVIFLQPLDWPERYRNRTRALRLEHDAIFRAVVREGIASGEFYVDEDVAMHNLYGAMNYTPVWLRGLSKKQFEAKADAVATNMLRLFVAP